MSDEVIERIILNSLYAPGIWFVLLLVAGAGCLGRPESRFWAACMGALLGTGVVALIGFGIGLAFGLYVTRDSGYPLPGIPAVLAAVFLAPLGAIIGAVIAVRRKENPW